MADIDGDRAHREVRIDLANSIDRWRYTCPIGHTIGEINAYTESYYSPRCGQSHGIDSPTWRYIVDQRTNDEIPFNRVSIALFVELVECFQPSLRV